MKIYVILEIGKRYRLLKAFRKEKAARKFLAELNEEMSMFAKQPDRWIVEVELE